MELEDFKRGVQMRTAQGQWALPAGLPDLQGLPEAKLAPLASGQPRCPSQEVGPWKRCVVWPGTHPCMPQAPSASFEQV